MRLYWLKNQHIIDFEPNNYTANQKRGYLSVIHCKKPGQEIIRMNDEMFAFKSILMLLIIITFNRKSIQVGRKTSGKSLIKRE